VGISWTLRTLLAKNVLDVGMRMIASISFQFGWLGKSALAEPGV
jgi:hypothetical protein